MIRMIVAFRIFCRNLICESIDYVVDFLIDIKKKTSILLIRPIISFRDGGLNLIRC